MEDKELKTIRNLVSASNIIIIVSIFFMGVPLGLIAVVCAVVAWYKLRKYSATHEISDNLHRFYSKRITMVLILTSVIFLLNVYSAYTMYPYVADYINNLTGQNGAIQGSSSVSNNGSIWG